jgi:deoxyribodipyrimidine photo-lyase
VTTAIVLFTRDLRVHDHPALVAAVGRADRVVPLFVFDDRILGSRYAAPNRVGFLLDALDDLRSSLRARGGDLVLRRGLVEAEVGAVAEETGATELHLTADVSGYATARLGRLRELDVEVHEHPGVVVVPPEELSPGGDKDHYAVFTPYWRRWSEHDHREPVDPPTTVPTPTTVRIGRLPSVEDVVDGERSPEVITGGETEGRRRFDAWLEGGVEVYDDGRDRLAEDGTSRLSAYLHLGCVSPTEIAARIDRRHNGHEAFLRQLCWREFNHQLLAADHDLPRADLRPKGDRWRDDDDAVAAWKEGRTGYPVVDAAMRQLRREGWMHNRARLLVASFLTKHLYLDWRIGAWHFMDWLVDGDLANNFAQWQWTAGTGADSRPNRMFNPVTQSRRYDPDGDYVRRYVPELAELDGATIHAPWEARDSLLAEELDYPPPIVDHQEARARFLDARGA